MKIIKINMGKFFIKFVESLSITRQIFYKSWKKFSGLMYFFFGF